MAVIYNLDDLDRDISKIDDHNKLLKLGNEFYSNEEYDFALRCYKKAAKLDKKNHKILNIMGTIYDEKGEFDKAIKCYVKAIKLKKDFYSAWYNMGRSNANKGELEEAIRCYKEALKLKPDKHNAWYNMGNAYHQMKDFDKAIECYEEVVKHKTDFWQALNNHGDSLIQKKEFENAIKFIEKAIEIIEKATETEPESQFVWTTLGEAYHGLRRYDEAMKCYEKALEIEPDFFVPRKNLELSKKMIEQKKKRFVEKESLKINKQSLQILEDEIEETKEKGETATREQLESREFLRRTIAELNLNLENSEKNLEILEPKYNTLNKDKIISDLESLIKNVMLGEVIGKDLREICRKVNKIEDEFFNDVIDNLHTNPDFRQELEKESKKIPVSDIKEKANGLLEEGADRKNLLNRLKTWLIDATSELKKHTVLRVFHFLLTDVLSLPEILDKIRILYLSANPENTKVLNFAKEIHAIREEIKNSYLQDRFILHIELAVMVKDLTDPIMEFAPDIVHFSGHGSIGSEIKLLDKSGEEAQTVPKIALANMFKQYKNQIRLVVLNACYSEDQAKAIAQHVDCVIGYPRAIEDVAAIAFSRGFYRALGKGSNVQVAIDSGKNQIELENASVKEPPELKTKESINPEKISFE